ncbi:hypothetical protein [Shewanella frigidimarina]|uniref:hypothetical protein n=1 Tax=Shewanella frigidimarina TaxID=56812 RepID=UPI003D7A5636
MQEINCCDPKIAKVGMEAALTILDKWKCTQAQVQAVLNLPENYKSLDLDTLKINREQIERISYILNIHASLRSTFSNPENVYGFMNMANNNEYFNGRKPIDLICNGEIEGFKSLTYYVDSLFDHSINKPIQYGISTPEK